MTYSRYFVTAYKTAVVLHTPLQIEVELGKIFQKYGWKRAKFVVTVKIYWSMKSDERGLSRKHIIESVKASLKRLQLPYVDIVVIHKADPMCPMEGQNAMNKFE